MSEVIDINKLIENKQAANLQALAKKNYLEITKDPWPIINSLQGRGDRFRKALHSIGLICRDERLCHSDRIKLIEFLLIKEKVIGPIA